MPPQQGPGPGQMQPNNPMFSPTGPGYIPLPGMPPHMLGGGGPGQGQNQGQGPQHQQHHPGQQGQHQHPNHQQHPSGSE